MWSDAGAGSTPQKMPKPEKSRGRRGRKLKAKCKAKAAVRGKTGDKDKVNYSAPYTQPNAASPPVHTPPAPRTSHS